MGEFVHLVDNAHIDCSAFIEKDDIGKNTNQSERKCRNYQPE